MCQSFLRCGLKRLMAETFFEVIVRKEAVIWILLFFLLLFYHEMCIILLHRWWMNKSNGMLLWLNMFLCLVKFLFLYTLECSRRLRTNKVTWPQTHNLSYSAVFLLWNELAFCQTRYWMPALHYHCTVVLIGRLGSSSVSPRCESKWIIGKGGHVCKYLNNFPQLRKCTWR